MLDTVVPTREKMTSRFTRSCAYGRRLHHLSREVIPTRENDVMFDRKWYRREKTTSSKLPLMWTSISRRVVPVEGRSWRILNPSPPFFLYVRLGTFMYLSTRMSGNSYRRRFKSLLLRFLVIYVTAVKPSNPPLPFFNWIQFSNTLFIPHGAVLFLLCVAPSGPFTCISPQNLSRVFPVLGVANTGSCVGPQNKIGHPAHRYRQLM